MKLILVFDENNSKCNLLKDIFNIMGSKKNRVKLSKNGISSNEYYLVVFKILFKYVFSKLKNSTMGR